jgi:hypothetical protein
VTRRGFLAVTSSAAVAAAFTRSAQAQTAQRATTQDLRRVDELRKMMIEEKAMQLSSVFSGAV